MRVTQLVRRLDHLEKEKGDIEARLEGWGKEERRLDEEAAKLQSEIDAKIRSSRLMRLLLAPIR